MSIQSQAPSESHREVPSGLVGLLGSVINAGRDILAKRRQVSAEAPSLGLAAKCHQLLHHRGEASGLALAVEVIADYQKLDESNRTIFFESLASNFEVSKESVFEALDQYKAEPSDDSLTAISKAVEAPRSKLFRRMNMAPEGTAVLVKMRGELLALLPERSDLKRVDADLRHQFISWFNRGFLELRLIDWNSPAAVLEKIIQYESVHAIRGWDDLRSRLRENRLCFAFFHPAMPDDPLVFVEIALTSGVPSAIAPLIERTEQPDSENDLDTVVFYSISNCHPGLAGVSFGNFLIKQVVEEVGKRHPTMKRYVTLSPVPDFLKWLKNLRDPEVLNSDELEALIEMESLEASAETRGKIMKLCAQYLVNERSNQLAIDPVARFHLGNGASLHQINWAANLSKKGLTQSLGLMVNYLYDIESIEVNHDAYFDQGEIAVSRSVAKLLQ